jgi:DNA-binding CsgD family transcriptional regulator/tetratricopeptide (TPR) repeat protein
VGQIGRLLEREPLLASMFAARDRAASGRGGTVLVEGEAGVGKTSLLQEFAAGAGNGARVAWGWCEALVTPRPLGPLQDMARALDPKVAELLEQGASPDRLFPALFNMLLDADEPTILIFEDVHWADEATLDLIRYMGRRISLMRALVVFSARSDELGPNHPLIQVLGDLPAATVTRVKPTALSEAAVASLALEAGRPAIGVYAATAGNPFFVTELLANTQESTVPDSVRDAVWSRLSRLPPGERDVLDLMSVMPGNVEIELIKTLLGQEAEDHVASAVGRGLLRRATPGEVTFRHELARQATLERLSPSVQRGLHLRIGEALSKLASAATAANLARRMHHAQGAEDAAAVLALAPQAASQASRLGAHQQAASFLSAALHYVEQVSSAEAAARLYESYAYEASLSLFDYDATIAAHHRAIGIWRELGNHPKVSLNLRQLSRLHWRRGEGALAQRMADLAVAEVELLPPTPELAMAYSVRSQLNMLNFRLEEAIRWGQRAIDMADELGVIETRVHALNNVGIAMLLDGRPEEGRRLLEEDLELALANDFHDHAARAYTNFAESAIITKDFALAERLLAEGIAFAARHDLDSSTQYLLGRQAQLRLEQGRLREAETIAQGVIGMEHLPIVMHLPALTVLGRVRIRMDEPGGDLLLKRALQEGLPTGEMQRILPVRLALAEAAWLDDDLDAARAQMHELTALNGGNTPNWDYCELAVWRKRLGVVGEPPITELGPYAKELAGDHRAAAAEWERLGLPYEAALQLAQVTGEAAADALGRAVQLFDSIEARKAAAFARRRAQQIGVPSRLTRNRRGPYAMARRHPLGLTSSEQQVLSLIAEGRSNKDIARQLDRSPRTVEHQVSAVLGKFSARNRVDVMLRLRTEPWLLEPSSTAA